MVFSSSLQRLLKYSTPTEVIVFKPLLDSRLQGFLSFNADANQLLRSGTCEIRLGGIDLQQARQAIFALVNQLRTDAWIQPPNRASPPNFGDQFGVPGMPGSFHDPSRGQQQQQMRVDSTAEMFASLSAPMGLANALATSAPTGTNGGFGIAGLQHDKVFLGTGSAAMHRCLCSGLRRTCWPVCR